MTNLEFIEAEIAKKGPHATLVALVAKMHKAEVHALLISTAMPVPTTVTWNYLRDVVARERVVAEELK